MSVEAATRAFGSPLRMHLIRYYLTNPGSQKAAVEALGVSQQAVSRNMGELVATGVIIEQAADADRRARVYRVNRARLDELVAALHGFATGR